mmetsp:Transcript_14050/g.57036  ORF Transcript_14050/g.57036 Transcript_14050/m.57036 type:complete len:215 (+) Transcript_14050:3945-4589(+)
MARHHMQRLFAACDWDWTISGVKSSRLTNFSRRLSVLGEMLSLSNSNRRFMKPVSPRTFLALAQSVFSFRRVSTASMVTPTNGGGLGKFLISTMSFLLRALSDSTAASSAGMASSRSALADAAMASVSAASALAWASSSITFFSTSAASALSLLTCSMSSAVAADFSSSTGCSSPNSIFRLSMITLVSASLFRPLSRRSFALPSSSLFSASRAV